MSRRIRGKCSTTKEKFLKKWCSYTPALLRNGPHQFFASFLRANFCLPCFGWSHCIVLIKMFIVKMTRDLFPQSVNGRSGRLYGQTPYTNSASWWLHPEHLVSLYQCWLPIRVKVSFSYIFDKGYFGPWVTLPRGGLTHAGWNADTCLSLL